MWKVLRSGSLHVVSKEARISGERVAITILDQPGVGVLVWSGLLSPGAVGKPAELIEMHDYVSRQTTSFSTWLMLWPFYESSTEFAPLVPELRRLVDERIASGDKVSAPGK